MLVLALALATLSPHPAPDAQRVKRTRVVTRARVPVRAQPGKVRLPIVTTTARNPDDRFRLTGLPDETPNGKLLAVRNPGMACGINGAPVCPSKGMPVVKAPLDD